MKGFSVLIFEIPQSLKKAHFGMTALFRVSVTNNYQLKTNNYF